jgi:hypothetical protein
MYSRKKRRLNSRFTKRKQRHKFKGGTASTTRSQQRFTRGQAQTKRIRLRSPSELSSTRRRKPKSTKRPQEQQEQQQEQQEQQEQEEQQEQQQEQQQEVQQQQEEQEEQQEQQEQQQEEQQEPAYGAEDLQNIDTTSMEMLPERIPNRPSNKDYVPVFISQSRRLQRQKKFRSKRRKCKKSAILLDVEENCDPMLVPVTKDRIKGDYIVLGKNRIRLKSKFLRGRYRNLQDMTLVQIPQVAQHELQEPLVEINEENTTPEEFSDILSRATSPSNSRAQAEDETQAQEQEQEQEQEEDQPMNNDTITYRYEKVGKNGDVNIYISNSLEFLVRESAFLKAIGIENQKGLYTAKTRHKGDILGRYSGKLLGAESALDINERKDKVPDSRYLLTIQPPKGPRVIIDGAQPLQSPEEQKRVLSFKKKLNNGLVVDSKATQLSLMQYPYPGICAQYMNDAAGPIKIKNIKNNIRFAQNGNIEAIRTIPGYDLSKTFEENIKSEMLVPYGSGYWKDMDKNKITVASVDFCKAIPGQTVASKELFRVKK